MIREGRRTFALAMALSALAGFVDANGFIASRGDFVAFMSGNSTLLALGAAWPSARAARAGALIAAFVAGVAGGSALGERAARQRGVILLLLIAALLAGAAVLGSGMPALLLLAVAMGGENALFEQDGEVRVGLTYMTGTLVRVGQGIAGVILRRPRTGWTRFLALWLALVAGAALGGLAHARGGLNALWLAAGCAALLAPLTARPSPAPRPRHP